MTAKALIPEEVDTDKVIADELSKLSIIERERVYEDIHGVDAQVEETPDLVYESLIKLEEELNSISNKDAYCIALNISEAYVNDRKFRLSFLRAESFDIPQAARRMVRYFENKRNLFGEEKLAKTIELEDLSEDDKKCMAIGVVQILPQRDSSGRAVVIALDAFHLRCYVTNENPEQNVLRYWWYLMSAAAEDEETQQKGIVYLCYGLDAASSLRLDTDRKVWWGCSVLAQCLPLRIPCVHYVYNDIRLLPIINVVAMSVDRAIRVRLRTTYGTHMECQYKLLTYGIPIKTLPLTNDNREMKLAAHRNWLKRRYQKENASLPTVESDDTTAARPIAQSGVQLPSRFDVLLGKGRPCQEHHGNKYLHDIIARYYDEYNSATKRETKSKVADCVIDVIKACPGRFLKRDEMSGLWMEVKDREAREKVCHAFRRKREIDSKHDQKQIQTCASTSSISIIRGNKRMRFPGE